jgi:anti-sigma factor RsiW
MSMTCKEVADFILDYTTGELPVEVRSTFDRHLSLCANCREYLATYLTSVTLGRHAFDDAAKATDKGIPADLVAAILSSRPRRS